MICPKCQYARQPTDQAPDYECPSCGVNYVKYNLRANEALAAELNKAREPTPTPTLTHLVECPDCLGSISARARVCPHCGLIYRKNRDRSIAVAITLLGWPMGLNYFYLSQPVNGLAMALVASFFAGIALAGFPFVFLVVLVFPIWELIALATYSDDAFDAKYNPPVKSKTIG